MPDIGWVADDNPVLGQLDSAATRYGVDRNLAHVVAQMESGYNPNADSGKAQGVMQLTPATGTALGVRNRFDSAENVDAGVRLLSQLLRKYGGDTRRVLAAYNAGEPAVDKAGGVPNYPETQNYVAKGLGMLYPTPAAPAQPSDDAIGWVADPEPPAAPAKAAAPAQPSTLQHAIDVLGESSGFKLASDLLGGGAKALMDRIVGNAPDVQAEQRATGALKAIAQGIAGEPERIRQQLALSGQAMLNGDVNEAANHLWYAVPLAGAAGQQMAEYLKAGDVVGALAHATGTLLPIAHEPAIATAKAAAETTAEAAAKAATAARGATTGAFQAVPTAVGKGLEYAGYGLMGGPHGAVTGFKIGAGRALGKGAIAGAREALAERAASIAADEAAQRAATASAAPGGYPVPQEPPPPVIPPERQLEAGPSVIVPPQEDRSFVRAVPAQYPETEPGWTPPAQPAPPPPPEPAITLDDLARSLGGKKFDKLSAADQAKIQSVYNRIQNPLPVTPLEPGMPAPTPPEQAQTLGMEYNAPTPAPTPAPVAPAETAPTQPPTAIAATPETAATGPLAGKPEAQAIAAKLEKSTRVERLMDTVTRTLGITDPAELDVIQPHEWDAIGRSAGGLAPEADDIAQVRQNLADAQAAQKIEKPAELTPAAAEESFQQKIRKAKDAAPAAPEPAAETEETSQPTLRDLMEPGRLYGPRGEFKSPQLRGQQIRLRNIELKAQRFAAALRLYGLEAADLEHIPKGWVPAEDIAKGGMPGWQNVMHDIIARGLLGATERNPPGQSLPRIIELMRKMEAGAAPAAPAETGASLGELMNPETKAVTPKRTRKLKTGTD
jgi:hypothetical protein